MATSDVPDDVAQFLRAHIRSVMQLEVLVLLHRDPQVWRTAGEIDRDLRSSLEATRKHLAELHGSQLLEIQQGAEPRFRFAPARIEDRETVLVLVELFRDRFHSIVDTIYARRSNGAKAFADAFKLRKDGDDDG